MSRLVDLGVTGKKPPLERAGRKAVSPGENPGSVGAK